MTSASSKQAALAFPALAAGACLLVLAGAMPPKGLCDPLVSAGNVALAGAQVLGLIAFVLLRKASREGGVLGAIGVAWAATSGGALIMRTCAGQLGAVGALDAAYALGGGAALAMLLGGLSANPRGAGRTAFLALLSALAGVGAARLADGRAVDRVWVTWSRLQTAGMALASARAADGRLPPGDGAELAAVASALPADARAGIPVEDAWGRPLIYTLEDGSWRLASLGADGEEGPYAEGPSRDFVDDLVVQDGSPLAWPESPCAPGPRPPPKRSEPVDLRGRRGP